MKQVKTISYLLAFCLCLLIPFARADDLTGVKVKIACIGDSITYGANVDPTADSYPAVLQRLLGDGYEVHNYGAIAQTLMKGTGASFWDTQQFKDATALNPDIVTIMLGTNDSKGGAVVNGQWDGAQQYAADYAALISHFAALPSHPRIWAIIPVPANGDTAYGIRGSVIQAYIVPLVRQVAAATHIPVIDLNAPMQGRPEDFPDDVHPNKEGQARMAQVVYAYLTGQPVILPAGGLFVHPVRVSLVPTAPSRNIRYTLDGTSPTLASIPYTSPFVIAQGCTVKSSEFGANGKAGSFTSSDFSIVPPLAASQPDGPSPGLSYSFYHNSSDNALGDPAKLTADETGTVLDPGNLPHSGEGDCGFLLSGYIKVPTTGVYSFWVGSYATSIIYIDDIKVAESGGVKGFHLHTAETGSIGLAAGLHKIAVVYSQVDGAETGLALRYVGPGVPLQSIPAAELSH